MRVCPTARRVGQQGVWASMAAYDDAGKWSSAVKTAVLLGGLNPSKYDIFAASIVREASLSCKRRDEPVAFDGSLRDAINAAVVALQKKLKMDYGEARKRAHLLASNTAVVALLSAEEWSGSATPATVAATALPKEEEVDVPVTIDPPTFEALTNLMITRLGKVPHRAVLEWAVRALVWVHEQGDGEGDGVQRPWDR